jgi:large subunit ribosomal protein L25
MEQLELKVTTRAESGKTAAKRLKEKGLIPAVLYGKGEPTVLLAVEEKAFLHAFREASYYSTLLKLTLEDGPSEGEGPSVMIKEVQHHPVSDRLLNIDFCRISLTERISTTVPLICRGEPRGLRQGGILEQVVHDLPVLCLPTDLPDHIEVDISQLEIGDALHIRDLAPPSGVSITAPEDEAVIILAPPVKVEEAVPAPAAEEEAPAEPEVVARGKETAAEEEERAEEK